MQEEKLENLSQKTFSQMNVLGMVDLMDEEDAILEYNVDPCAICGKTICITADICSDNSHTSIYEDNDMVR